MSESYELPQTLEPAQLARRCAHIEGVFEVEALERLRDVTCETTGSVAFDLHFSVDDQYRVLVRGHIQGAVSMTCERCLEAVTTPIDSDFCQAVVMTESQAAQLPRSLDPLFLDDNGKVSLKGLIEEETLLSLPIVARHPEGVCQLRFCQAPAAEASGQNPFKVLGRLKTDA
jgi:uncharacterized protein